MSDLSLLQASALASEISLAKTYATKSNNLVNSLTNEHNQLKNVVYVNDVSMNILMLKVQNLCDLLSQADISGVNDVSLNYNNL